MTDNYFSHAVDDFNVSQESVEVEASAILPLHARDSLRSPLSPIHRSSSDNSLASSRRNSGFGGETEDLVVDSPPHHSLPSVELATGDLEVNTNTPMAVAEFKNEEGEEVSYHVGNPRRMQWVLAAVCFLLVLAAILIGVYMGNKDESETSMEGNQAVIDKDDPNNIPPTAAPLPDDDIYGNGDFTYVPGDNPGTSLDTPNNINFCPIMSVPGDIISNFTNSIYLQGIIDNSTLIGSNNNPNATSDALRLIPSCQENVRYGRGLWWVVQGPGAVVRATTCQSLGFVWEDSTSTAAGLPLDTQLSVFTGSPTCSGGLECVTGNDDASCGAQSTVSWYAEKDQLYYIFVSGKPNGTTDDAIEGTSEEPTDPENEQDSSITYPTGSLGLTLELAPIGTCDAAIDYKTEAVAVSKIVMDPGQQTQVPLDSSEIVGTLLGAKIDLDPCAPGQWLGRGGEIWYKVTGNGRWVMASTCSRTSANEFPARLALYHGFCDHLECGLSKASDNAPTVDRDCGFGYSLNWWAQQGVDYYIMVYKTNFLPGIQFGLTVEDLNPPSNDNCTGATQLYADGTVTYGSTLQATYTPSQIAPTCMAEGPVTHSHPGVWYKVLGTGTRLTASLCNEETEFDTKISVFEGSCGELKCVFANDDWCGYQSSVYWKSTAGTTYYLLVHGSEGGMLASMGDFGLAVFEFKPSVNDYCADAIVVEPGSVTRGTTSTASADDDVESCDYTGTTSSNVAPGVWYKVIGTGNGIRASTCGAGTTFDTRISIYFGSSCDQLGCIMSDDNGCGFQSSAYWFSREGETYYILVTGNLFSSFGDFVLRVEDYRPNTINDFCANAISASTTTVNLGSTKNATFDGVKNCVVSNTAPGIWYKVQGSGTGMIATTCHIVTDFDTRISVFRGADCESLECVAGNDDSHQTSDCGSSAGSRVSWLSSSGEDYYILVHGWGALVGTFGLLIEGVVSVVANDFCITSSDIEVSLGQNSSSREFLVQGTTIGATVNNVPVCGDVEAIGAGVWYKGVGTGNRLVASTCNENSAYDNTATLSTLMPGVVTDFDTQISVFRGGCRTLQCVGANNDRCGLQSSVNFFMEEGEPFYVMVHGAGDAKGSFGLAIHEIFPQVANDFCNVATPFSVAADGGTNRVVGSTVEASYDTVAECIVKNTAPGVWYRTTGTGQIVTVTTCGGQTDFDTRLSVYTGSCQALDCVTGNDDTSRDTASCGLASTASWQSIQGQTYYIRVHGWGSLTGNFQLSIYETQAE